MNEWMDGWMNEKKDSIMTSFCLFICTAMAGNIIPAIATTNACIAGLIVIEALKVLANKMDKCKSVQYGF